MPDVVCFGDLLMDFVPTASGLDFADLPTFMPVPGGAAANVAVGLAKLGVASGFIGKVGDEPFGHVLIDTLKREGVDVSSIRLESKARTALAFVTLTADGERDFMFYRHPSADMLFTPDEVDLASIERADIFHFDSISLASPQPRETALFAASKAKAWGKLISYDVNLRLPLWQSDEQAKHGILEGMQYAEIVKLSDDELDFLTGSRAPEAIRKKIWHNGLRLVVLSLGQKGCIAITEQSELAVPSLSVEVIDTTGAGDGFVAGLLSGIVAERRVLDDDGALFGLCRFANAVGALTTTARGAIPSLPSRKQVDDLLANG
ncbi:MAG: PfkB family carbohydrate kinase [Alphaproteobacteria bacterium]|nr:PfkB family carbohydrate kinase [Alphaproteobacteria bacterium]